LEKITTFSEEEISSSGYTVSTVEAAFWSVLRSSSFEEALVTAATLGDDADTVAAVAGAMAGAYYGYNAIPYRWIKSLLNEPKLHSMAQELTEANSTSANA
jgi:ADP-ribosylglycohydrolase